VISEALGTGGTRRRTAELLALGNKEAAGMLLCRRIMSGIEGCLCRRIMSGGDGAAVIGRDNSGRLGKSDMNSPIPDYWTH
jgi:hypothetical protein